MKKKLRDEMGEKDGSVEKLEESGRSLKYMKTPNSSTGGLKIEKPNVNV
jgi:hypothetical protein